MRKFFGSAGVFLFLVNFSFSAQQLEPGKPVVQEISGEQKQSFSVNLEANQYARVDIHQKAFDVKARLIGPDNDPIADFDLERTGRGDENVEIVSSTAGTYQVDVQAVYSGFPAGKYEIELSEVRPATERDRSLAEGTHNLYLARRSFVAGKYDEAVELAEKAVKVRAEILGPVPGAREIGDRAEAIASAIEALAPGDCLVVAGKGHEPGQIVGKTVHPFSDHDAVRAAVAGQDYHG